jgi:glycosyltransferase involved in cell wall biosynthesis
MSINKGRTPFAFVGPCPPPLGGVAVTNINFQRLLADDYDLEIFNTSKGREREDLYGKKGLKEIAESFILLIRYVVFLFSLKSKCVNIFVTSNLAFIRDVFFIVVAKLFLKKIIIHFHSKTSGELFLGRFTIRIMAFFINFADVIVVLSPAHMQYFSKYLHSRKMIVIENFVFVSDLEPTTERSKKEFIFVGRLTEKKGFYDLIDAVSILGKSIKVNVLGAAETDEADLKIKQYISQLGVADNFVFFGVIGGEEKFSVFHRSSIMLFPSHFENSPVVLKEGLAARQVIISSDLDANKNVLSNSSAVLMFEAKNPQALADCMGRLIEDEALFIDYSKKAVCPEHARDDFARNSYIEMIKSLNV